MKIESPKIESPFVYNNPVVDNEKFFDRENLLEEMFNQLFLRIDDGNVWLYGTHQTGKTSILKYIVRNFNDGNYFTSDKFDRREIKFIYFDCQDVDRNASIFYDIASKINDDLNLKVNKDANDLFTEVFKEVYEKKYFIILLLDDFDFLISTLDTKEKIKTRDLLNNIRAKINSIQKIPGQPRLIRAVFAVDRFGNGLSKELSESLQSGSPLNYQKIDVKWFNKENIKKLITHYGINNTFFTITDIHLCYRLSKGHPSIVQKVLDTIYIRKNEKGGLLNSNDYQEIIKEIQDYIFDKVPYLLEIAPPN